MLIEYNNWPKTKDNKINNYIEKGLRLCWSF